MIRMGVQHRHFDTVLHPQDSITRAIMEPLMICFGFRQKTLVPLLLVAILSTYMMGILISNTDGA